MADEDLIDLEDNAQSPVEDKSDNRLRNLANKVRTVAEERDAALKEKQLQQEEIQKTKREVEFYKGLGAIATQNPAVLEYQEQIMDKVVNNGYSIEDAAVSILVKENKYQPPMSNPQPIVESPAGGTSPNAFRGGGEKSVGDMTQEERRNALLQAEADGGAISQLLRRGSTI